MIGFDYETDRQMHLISETKWSRLMKWYTDYRPDFFTEAPAHLQPSQTAQPSAIGARRESHPEEIRVASDGASSSSAAAGSWFGPGRPSSTGGSLSARTVTKGASGSSSSNDPSTATWSPSLRTVTLGATGSSLSNDPSPAASASPRGKGGSEGNRSGKGRSKPKAKGKRRRRARRDNANQDGEGRVKSHRRKRRCKMHRRRGGGIGPPARADGWRADAGGWRATHVAGPGTNRHGQNDPQFPSTAKGADPSRKGKGIGKGKFDLSNNNSDPPPNRKAGRQAEWAAGGGFTSFAP